MELIINNKLVRLDARQALTNGKGMEADVYNLGTGQVLKLYKQPNHPDYQGSPHEQEGARRRLLEHQKKLPLFPKSLPARVVAPLDLAWSKDKKSIVGYTMPYLAQAEKLARYADRTFREKGIGSDLVVKIFLDLLATVIELHKKNVVVGDFTDFNIMVMGSEAYIIDADSFQFGQFICRMFTLKYADPLLCSETPEHHLILQQPHNDNSDWYAFEVMLMRSLLYTDPYGGIYRPKIKTQPVTFELRPLKRLNVFHPDVRYPGPALPLTYLPDDLLHHFEQVFVKDWRGLFPEKLLTSLRFTKCLRCGCEHARTICPECAYAEPLAIKQKTVVRGKMTVTHLFETKGIILQAAVMNKQLRYLYHEGHNYKRENNKNLLRGELSPYLRYRLFNEQTIFGQAGQMFVLDLDGNVQGQQAVDHYGALPMFSANNKNYYWLSSGRLLRADDYGPTLLGEVLAQKTLFWVGDKLGFGFYQAAELFMPFIFEADSLGCTNIKLTPLAGQLLDATCVFSQNLIWFLTQTQENGHTKNHCYVIDAGGALKAEASAEQGDGSWLGTIRGKCAAGNFLFSPSDDGIIRVEPDQNQIAVTREFPDTLGIVDASCHLLVGTDGLYVIKRHEILNLKLF